MTQFGGCTCGMNNCRWCSVNWPWPAYSQGGASDREMLARILVVLERIDERLKLIEQEAR